MARLAAQFATVWALVGAVLANYRLPAEVMPENYKLEILSHLGVEENFDFDGKVWIQVRDRAQNSFATIFCIYYCK